jgi:hypothetical protein
MSKYAKAIVPLVAGFVLLLLQPLGLTETSTLGEALTAILGAIAVYFVPNKS